MSPSSSSFWSKPDGQAVVSRRSTPPKLNHEKKHTQDGWKVQTARNMFENHWKSRQCSWLVIAWLSYLPQGLHTRYPRYPHVCIHEISWNIKKYHEISWNICFLKRKEDPVIYYGTMPFIPDQLPLPSRTSPREDVDWFRLTQLRWRHVSTCPLRPLA